MIRDLNPTWSIIIAQVIIALMIWGNIYKQNKDVPPIEKVISNNPPKFKQCLNLEEENKNLKSEIEVIKSENNMIKAENDLIKSEKKLIEIDKEKLQQSLINNILFNDNWEYKYCRLRYRKDIFGNYNILPIEAEEFKQCLNYLEEGK